jgi:predicted cation transporter
MKALRYTWIVLFLLMTTLTSCEAIGDIFQAGIGVGIFIVVLVVGLVIWLISRFRR